VAGRRGLQPPGHLHAVGVERLGSSGAGGDGDCGDERAEDGRLPVEVEFGPVAVQRVAVPESGEGVGPGDLCQAAFEGLYAGLDGNACLLPLSPVDPSGPELLGKIIERLPLFRQFGRKL
jgi:hypothetical protein